MCVSGFQCATVWGQLKPAMVLRLLESSSVSSILILVEAFRASPSDTQLRVLQLLLMPITCFSFPFRSHHEIAHSPLCPAPCPQRKSAESGVILCLFHLQSFPSYFLACLSQTFNVRASSLSLSPSPCDRTDDPTVPPWWSLNPSRQAITVS